MYLNRHNMYDNLHQWFKERVDKKEDPNREKVEKYATYLCLVEDLEERLPAWKKELETKLEAEKVKNPAHQIADTDPRVLEILVEPGVSKFIETNYKVGTGDDEEAAASAYRPKRNRGGPLGRRRV